MRRPVAVIIAAIALIGVISEDSQAAERKTWGDIAGRRVDLPAAATVPIMTFHYGDGRDQLPLRYGDDPDRTVVTAYAVEDDESTWVLTAGGPGCDTLRHFVASSGEAIRDRILPLPHCFSGFLVRPEGVYLSGHTGRAEAQFWLLTSDQMLHPLSLIRTWGQEHRRLSNVGWLREAGGAYYACLSGDCVRIGSRSSSDTLDGDDFIGGLPSSGGEPIWQSGQVIFRGTAALLDLDDHGYLWDVVDAGFVLGRSNVYAEGSLARLVEILDENGKELRSFVIPTPPGQYGMGEGGPFFFTREHAYYLRLDREAAVLFRY